MRLHNPRTLVVATIALALAACRPAPPSAPLEVPNDGPPPPPAGAFLGQVAPTATSQLASLGVPVVVPGAVPPAFSIAELRVDRDGPSYLVVYQSAANQCFAVEFASDGTSPPPATEGRRPIQPPLFGDRPYAIHYGPFADPALQTEFPGDNLFTDWMSGPAGSYRIIGASYIGELFEPLRGCEDLSPEAAAALAESLTVITDDPMGDPAFP